MRPARRATIATSAAANTGIGASGSGCSWIRLQLARQRSTRGSPDRGSSKVHSSSSTGSSATRSWDEARKSSRADAAVIEFIAIRESTAPSIGRTSSTTGFPASIRQCRLKGKSPVRVPGARRCSTGVQAQGRRSHCCSGKAPRSPASRGASGGRRCRTAGRRSARACLDQLACGARGRGLRPTARRRSRACRLSG